MSSFCSSNIQISYSQIDIVTYVTSCYRLNAPAYRVQTILIKCTLKWLHKMKYVCRIPKGIRMEQALTKLDVKILFDDFTYHANICNSL